MWKLLIICLAKLASSSLIRPHHETLLVTDLETRAAYHDELTFLDGETRKLDSMILDVESHLLQAVKTFQSINNASSNMTKGKPVKASPAKAEGAKPLKNLTLAKAASSKTAPSTLIMSKADVNKTLHNEQNLLNDLMKHLNNQISNFKREDDESKTMAEKMRKKFEEKLKKDEAALQQKNLRDFDHARLVNATRMDKQDLAYWSKDGELRHSTIHANMQMSTNLLMSVQNVLAVYNQAVKKGGVDDGLLKKVQAAAMGKSFLQLRKDLQRRMQNYRAQLNAF